MVLRIQILGPIRAWRDGEALDLGPAAQRVLLGLLALAGGQPLSRAQIHSGVWYGRQPPSTAANVIQTHVKRLRRILEPDRPPRASSTILRQVGDGYALSLPAAAVDLPRFRQRVAAATDAQRQGRLEEAVEQLAEALALWHGAPLADIPALAEHPKVVALTAERQTAAARYGDVMVAAGRATEVVPMLEEAAAAQPLDEAGLARLIRAYHAAGRRGRAFAFYHEVLRRLADELGVAPGPELSAAHAALLRDEETPAKAEPPVRRVREAAPAQLPADIPDFVGRAAELSHLDGLLAAERGPVVCVSGTAGVGKTALAVHIAHRVLDRFPDGQLYVNLRGYDPDQPATAIDALAGLLTALGVAGHDVPLDVDGRAARFRTELAGRRMLLLLDNAATVEQVRPLLPGTATCAVVVTSRDSLAGLVALHGAHRLDLDLLPPADAHALLSRLVGARAGADTGAVAVLADQCARLPLALRVAAELAVSRPTTTLADLTVELGDQRERLDLLDAGGDPRAAVTAVFSWSIRHLPATTGRVFRLLGLHPGADADAHAVAALTGTAHGPARRALDALARAHLVHPTTAGRYGMHDLLRAYAAVLTAMEDPTPEREAAVGRLFDYYLAAATAATESLYPVDEYRRIAPPVTPIPDLTSPDAARRWLDAERLNLVAVAGYAAAHGWPTHTVRLSAVLHYYLDGGHYADALAVHGLAREAAEKVGDRSGQALASHSLGAAQVRLGAYRMATEHLQRAVDLFQRTGNRAGEARALSVLGIVDSSQGRHRVAADCLRRALEVFRQLGDLPGQSNTVNNLGVIDAQLGRYEAAIVHFQQALDLSRRLADDTKQANALGNLGKTEGDLGRHEAAADHLGQALTLYRRLGDRAGEARTLDNLGIARARLGHHDDAGASYARALTLFREIGDRVGEAWVRNGMGELGRATGHLADALTHHSAALTVATEIGHPDQQARAHVGLGHAHRGLDNPSRARHHFERAIALYTDLGSTEAEVVRAHLDTC